VEKFTLLHPTYRQMPNVANCIVHISGTKMSQLFPPLSFFLPFLLHPRHLFNCSFGIPNIDESGRKVFWLKSFIHILVRQMSQKRETYQPATRQVEVVGRHSILSLFPSLRYHASPHFAHKREQSIFAERSRTKHPPISRHYVKNRRRYHRRKGLGHGFGPCL